MRKPAVPDIPPMKDVATRRVLQALKENVETMSGRRGGRIKELEPAAVLAAVIDKVNELLERLQN